jgi:hypothetical protein
MDEKSDSAWSYSEIIRLGARRDPTHRDRAADSLYLTGDDPDNFLEVRATPAAAHKCPRCWMFLADWDGDVCRRCTKVLAQS